MPVECRMSRTSTHLSCRNGRRVRVGPSRLDILPVGTSNTWPVVEREFCVTIWPVSRKVEFRNEEFQYELVQRDPELFSVFQHSSKQIDVPAAYDVVGNLDSFDLLPFQRTHKREIHVGEPCTDQSNGKEYDQVTDTDLSPFCRSTTPFLRMKPCRQTIAPTPDTVKSFDRFELAWFTAWNSVPQVSISWDVRTLSDRRIS